jgi:hypothetical protein
VEFDLASLGGWNLNLVRLRGIIAKTHPRQKNFQLAIKALVAGSRGTRREEKASYPMNPVS